MYLYSIRFLISLPFLGDRSVHRLICAPNGHLRRVTKSGTRCCIDKIRSSWRWAQYCSKHVEEHNRFNEEFVHRVGKQDSIVCTKMRGRQYIKIQICFSKAPSWLYKLQWLTYRAFLQVLRDPSVQLIRIVQKIVRIVERTAEWCFVMGYSGACCRTECRMVFCYGI